MQLPQMSAEFDRGTWIRSSADGTVFTICKSTPAAGVAALVIEGNHATQYHQYANVSYAIPDASGDTIFTSLGTYDTELQSKEVREAADDSPAPVPAVEGPLFVGVAGAALVRPTHVARSPNAHISPPARTATVTIHAKSILNPLVTIPDVEIGSGNYATRHRNALTLDKRVVYNPSANVLATLSESDDEVVLRRFNLEKALKAGGKDYLAVISSPPTRYSVGQPLRYAIKTLSSRGSVTYNLQSGPGGMTLSKDGLVQWAPKAGAGDAAVNVIILIADASGKNVIHQFNLRNESAGRTDFAGAAGSQRASSQHAGSRCDGSRRDEARLDGADSSDVPARGRRRRGGGRRQYEADRRASQVRRCLPCRRRPVPRVAIALRVGIGNRRFEGSQAGRHDSDRRRRNAVHGRAGRRS